MNEDIPFLQYTYVICVLHLYVRTYVYVRTCMHMYIYMCDYSHCISWYSRTLFTQNHLTQISVNTKAVNGPFKAPRIPNCCYNIKF